MIDVFVVDAVRTWFGKFRGGLSGARPGGGLGLATACIGVGQGLAMVLEA
jgi:acetyl-CoA acetyltransferase